MVENSREYGVIYGAELACFGLFSDQILLNSLYIFYVRFPADCLIYYHTKKCTFNVHTIPVYVQYLNINLQ